MTLPKMIPIVGGSDRETIEKAIFSMPRVRNEPLKIAWIKNTNEIEYIALSEMALAHCDKESLEPLRDVDWVFDEEERLTPWKKE